MCIRDRYNVLLNSDLVILSACETARGELQRGEGIISLARAFAYAGAKSIVTTLWVVDDKATRDIMQLFHAELAKEGAMKNNALMTAKRLFRGKYPEKIHPFFWAALIPVGDMSPLK